MNMPVPPLAGFWGLASPCEHLLEVYKSDTAFVAGLVEFASQGLADGEAFVMFATVEHRLAVAGALRERGHEIGAASDAYVSLDAGQTLARFMVDGQPDAARFDTEVGAVIDRAAYEGRRVRAFGEMMALLWLEDRHDATVRVEQLWHGLLAHHPLTLFCAYPRLAATRDITDDFAEVCAAHSQVAFT